MSSARIRSFLVPFVLGAGLVVGVIWWRDRAASGPEESGFASTAATANAIGYSSAQQGASAGALEGAMAAATPTAMDATPTNAIAAPALPPEPLPPPGTPVAELFDALSARAERGDPHAGCRLASELLRCAEARAQATATADYEKGMARRDETPEAAVRWLAQMQTRIESSGKGCEGLSQMQIDHAFDLQLRTALADPKARVWFALQPALDPWNFIQDLERWTTYRRYAMPWLEEAAAQGDPTALIALARVHGDLRRTGPPTPRFRIPDDEKFLVYAELMHRRGIDFTVVAHEAKTARARLDAASLQRVSERVATLERRDLPALDEKSVGTALDRSLRPNPKPEDCAAP